MSKRALKVVKKDLSLQEIIDGYNYWIDLYNEWLFRENKHEFVLESSDNRANLYELFIKLENADINKKEFRGRMGRFVKVVRAYEMKLQKAISEQEKIIEADYDNFMEKNAGVYRFIVEQPEIATMILTWMGVYDNN